MNNTQLDKLLTRSGLSQSEAARRVGVDGRTMRRYIAGDSEIPLAVEIAIGAVTDTWSQTLELREINKRYRNLVELAKHELRRIVADGYNGKRIAASALGKIEAEQAKFLDRLG